MEKAVQDDFGRVLQEAVRLLRGLPRAYKDVPEAQRQFAEWRMARPDLCADLLVDRPPGSLSVAYDVLLGHPDGGTLALTVQEENGLPWLVSYADHWAANLVVTVNDQSITVQQALLALRMWATGRPDILTELVNHRLLLQAIESDKPSVTREELQEAADCFRRAAGLHSATATFRWLEDLRLTPAQFEALVEATVQGHKVRQRVTTERLAAYFEAHRDEYYRVRLFEVRAPSLELARRLAAAAQATGLIGATEALFRDPSLPPVNGIMTTRLAGALSSSLRTASPGEIVGPHQEGCHYLVAQVYDRQMACLDDETRQAVEEAVYQEWLAEQRAEATVQWHWT